MPGTPPLLLDTDELAVHLARRLGLPARPAVAFGAALGRIEAFRATWDEVAAVRRVRGVGPRRSLLPPVRTIGAMTFTVLVRVLGSAVELSTAMDARGFANAERRTWVTPARWGKGDTLLTLAFALLPLGALAARLAGCSSAGEIGACRRVVIETTGLAEPAPDVAGLIERTVWEPEYRVFA